MKKLRVGFLLDTLQPPIKINELIELVHDNDSFDTPTLITGYKNIDHQTYLEKIVKKFKKNPIRFFDQILRAILYRFIYGVEIKSAKKCFPKYRANKDIQDLNKLKIVNVKGRWSKSNLFLEFTDEDLSLISSCDLDCIIRCESGVLRGKILDITEFGIFSFHHGDNRIIRGGPSGFWEVLYGEPSSGFIIQKLNDELDGGGASARRVRLPIVGALLHAGADHA